MRLLIFTDSPTLPTSYANVGRYFADAVSQLGVEVAFGSLQHSGNVLTYEYNGRTYQHFGCAPTHRIPVAIRDYNPDVIMHIRDPVALSPKLYHPQSYSIKAHARGRPVIQWVPVQHELLPYEYVEVLHRESDLTLVFTKAGVARLGNAGHVRDRMDYLPIGVSPAYSDPEGAEAHGYGRVGIPIVMSVGLGNQDRKAFPVLMRAYREALSSDPTLDLDFYLHTTPAGAFDLVEHTKMLGVQGHWMFPRAHDPGIGNTEAELAMRYRRALAYVSCSTGEGFNMPLSEAAALGRVMIHPRTPNETEVLEDYEGPKLSYGTHPIPRANNWEWLPDPEDLAVQLLKLRELKTDPAAGRRYYERHAWPRVAERFMGLVKDRGWK